MDEVEIPQPTPTPAQTKTPGTGPAPATLQRSPDTRALLSLLEHVKSCKDASGRKYCELFAKLPSRREWPEYYLAVTYPIDAAAIAVRAKARETADVVAFVSDVNLWLTNTLIAYVEDTSVCDDAEFLLEVRNDCEVLYAPTPHR